VPPVNPSGRTTRLSLDRGRARIHLRWEPWTQLAEGVASVLGDRRGARDR
jgi:hypothetical protein